jgi:hypothetical protein
MPSASLSINDVVEVVDGTVVAGCTVVVFDTATVVVLDTDGTVVVLEEDEEVVNAGSP